MRCNIFYVDQITGTETLNNVRHIDEIIEDNGLSDDEADELEAKMNAGGEVSMGGGAAPLFRIRPCSKFREE